MASPEPRSCNRRVTNGETYAVRVKRILLTAWLVLPLALVVLLCVWIGRSLNRGAIESPAPRGQGAGQTGGANAIGELLAGRRADGSSCESAQTQLWEVIVEDRSRVATPEQPLYLTSTMVNWDPAHPDAMMTELEPGLWIWRAEIPVGGEAFEFAISRGSATSFESDPANPLVPHARRKLDPGSDPDAGGVRRARITLDGFIDRAENPGSR